MATLGRRSRGRLGPLAEPDCKGLHGLITPRFLPHCGFMALGQILGRGRFLFPRGQRPFILILACLHSFLAEQKMTLLSQSQLLPSPRFGLSFFLLLSSAVSQKQHQKGPIVHWPSSKAIPVAAGPCWRRLPKGGRTQKTGPLASLDSL